MQLCRSLCSFLDRYVTPDIPSLHGLVCVGSVSYIDATDTDLDLLVINSSRDTKTLEMLHDVLSRPLIQEKLHRDYGAQATVLNLVKARVPVLKMNLYDSDTAQVWPVDIGVLVALRQSDSFVLYDVPEIMPYVIDKGRQFLSLRFTEFVRQKMRDNSLFSGSLIVLIRRWAQNRQLYGTIYGFPGGSAWIVMLWLFCELHNGIPSVCIDDTSFLRLMFMFYAKWPWPLPLTRVNCFAVFKNDENGYDWRYLPMGVTKHCCGEVVVPLPDEVQDEPTITQVNMTHTVGVIQHATILWEMQRAMAYNIELLQPLFMDNQLGAGTFYIVFVCESGNDMQWETHVQSMGISRTIDQLYHIGVLSRPLSLVSNREDTVRMRWNDDTDTIKRCLPVTLMCWMVDNKQHATDSAKDIVDAIQRVSEAIQTTYTNDIQSDIAVEISHMRPYIVHTE